MQARGKEEQHGVGGSSCSKGPDWQQRGTVCVVNYVVYAPAVLSAIKTQPGHGVHQQSARFGSRVQVDPLPAGACRSQPTPVPFIPAKCRAKKTPWSHEGSVGETQHRGAAEPLQGSSRCWCPCVLQLGELRLPCGAQLAGTVLRKCWHPQQFTGETMEQIWKRINVLWHRVTRSRAANLEAPVTAEQPKSAPRPAQGNAA